MYNYSVALAHRVQHKVLKNTVNMILNVNENFIKWVCNKKFIQFEYIKNNLIRKSEAHKNRVTKCNENRSKDETKNKAPKIINTHQ
jgi:hypothetical protein